jgi:hypothetical protein
MVERNKKAAALAAAIFPVKAAKGGIGSRAMTGV